MRTEELVALLATAGDTVPAHSVSRRTAVALVLGALGATALMLGLLGLRPGLAERLLQPMFWVKTLFVASLAAASFVGLVRLSRPGASLGAVPAAIAAPVVLMWVLGVVTLAGAPTGTRTALLLGETWTSCPWLVALHAVPVFIAVVWAMRGLAPTRLGLSGAAAGFASGAVGALVYSIHCPELAAPFLGLWYVLGMLIPTVIGGVLGSRLLRW